MSTVKEAQLFRPPGGFVRAVNRLSQALMVVGAIACVVMMVHLMIDVAARTVFNSPLPGTLETTEYWWMTVLVLAGLGFAQMGDDNIRPTVLVDLLPPAWQRGAEVVATALLAVLAAGIMFYGWQAAVQSFELRQAALVADTSIPIWPGAFFVPVGAAVLMLQSVATMIQIAMGRARVSHGEDVI
ncbi:TRAP transporter small permease subunit [Rhodococcus sp. DMU1]|uniref:TRAP transporter small permease n=1 Tax=Rhodococcus sp. DMU1 TaxID=2722825 RepID=UPI00143E7D02|nr:TRAP transporter small permease subunit [Rhodococcus sp. DMU1]QIX53880.1 TRAP transporter small permease [Rhodococcus sp. DMU1]